jgi:hypothetical protein
MVETYDPNDPYGYQHSGVVNDLTEAYGDAARPYFRDILLKSKQVWVRVSAAKELTLMGDPSGYRNGMYGNIADKPAACGNAARTHASVGRAACGQLS